ncbi:MAG: alpha/beta hydrolase [Lentimicrobium sp.]|nr:alpha/beta hydrolase [Lentimicrobium sp.]
MKKRILKNGFDKEPASLPKQLVKKFIVKTGELNGRKVWTIFPKNSESSTVILFLHGGAFCANITRMHWRFVELLLDSTNAIFIVPDYPLAPEVTCIDTLEFLDSAYLQMNSEHPKKKMVFMGDSAGGGLVLSLAQKVRMDGRQQPDQIIMFSPWLDVSMANHDIAEFEKFDKVLSVDGLKMAGKNYAGNLDVKDFRVSPIFGSFSGLGKISVFIGTNEVFIADARRFKQLMDNQEIEFNYFEYPNMFHDWVLVPNLKETKDAISKFLGILSCLK